MIAEWQTDPWLATVAGASSSLAETQVEDVADIEAALARVRDGDPQAFAVVVHRFQRPLRAWLAARCPPELDADDLAQATLVTAFTRLADYRPGSDFAAWIWTIARFQLRGAYTGLSRQRDARQRHWPAIAYELQARRIDDAGPDPRLPALHACLGTLTGPVRHLLEQHYHHGTDLQTIAHQLGRTAGAVKKQLFSVRRILHDCIRRRLEVAHG